MIHRIFPFLTAILTISALLCSWLCLFPAPANAALGSDYTIVCGQTVGGTPFQCDMSTHYCYLCEEKSRISWATKLTEKVYKCLSKDTVVPKNCTRSNTGGTVGDQDVKIFGLTSNRAHVEGTNCVTENLVALYSSTCYSCEIVEMLVSAFVRAAAKAYQVSRQAGNAILVVGMILWIALFVLKNVSAFTTVEPMKMIQDLLIQLFKVFLAFVIINAGISTILSYTMEPIMLTGTDFGTAILVANEGISSTLGGSQ